MGIIDDLYNRVRQTTERSQQEQQEQQEKEPALKVAAAKEEDIDWNWPSVAFIQGLNDDPESREFSINGLKKYVQEHQIEHFFELREFKEELKIESWVDFDKQFPRLCEEYPEQLFTKFDINAREDIYEYGRDLWMDHEFAQNHPDPLEKYMKQYEDRTDYPDKYVFKDDMSIEDRLRVLNSTPISNAIYDEFRLPEGTTGREQYFDPYTSIKDFTEARDGYFHAEMVHHYDNMGSDFSESYYDIYVNSKTEHLMVLSRDYGGPGIDYHIAGKLNLTEMAKEHGIPQHLCELQLHVEKTYGDIGAWKPRTAVEGYYSVTRTDDGHANMLKIDIDKDKNITISSKHCKNYAEGIELMTKEYGLDHERKMELMPAIKQQEPAMDRGMER